MAIKNCKECGRSIGTLFDDPNPKAEYCKPSCKQKAYSRSLKEREAVTADQRRYGFLRSGSTEHAKSFIEIIFGDDADNGNV